LRYAFLLVTVLKGERSCSGSLADAVRYGNELLEAELLVDESKETAAAFVHTG
jgi:hypothetical protein